MTLPARARFARQLGRPRGMSGRLVGALLNRHNRALMATAVDELSLPADSVAADLGFGGGVGLDLLLRRVGAASQVHGVELSETMLNQAARRFHSDIAAGRLRLHAASMTELPQPSGTFDGLMTLNTIYYIDQLELALRELHRVLNASGRAIIGLADPDAMARRSFTQHGLRLRPVPTIMSQLEQAGFVLHNHRQLNHGRETVHLLVAKPNTLGGNSVPATPSTTDTSG